MAISYKQQRSCFRDILLCNSMSQSIHRKTKTSGNKIGRTKKHGGMHHSSQLITTAAPHVDPTNNHNGPNAPCVETSVFYMVVLGFRWKPQINKYTNLPETNSKPLHLINGWLEDWNVSFWGQKAYFQGAMFSFRKGKFPWGI